ncbi:serine hydrolase domain-containing protein [Spirosoma utsteinense]|uniref:serine hydrolase domain-containing protein n=1 Tax=Spirosoma utsteinense TaxID=2585773 RepID=UPI0016460822|nr:serine hydrolase domain-containing protein [Spirosoma utsteinense]MBC3787791.1 D-alanyl-D-alanine carboxypeptidase [Spirosoma utsteinense]
MRPFSTWCCSGDHVPLSRRLSRLGLLTLTALTLACQDHQEPALQDPNGQLRMQAAVDSVRRVLEDSLQGVVPSMNVLIQTPTQTYFVSSVAPGVQPLTPNTFFRFASNSKNFTSAAILTMYQDGWLDYKAHITDLIPGTDKPYVPASADWAIPNKDQITIEQLLQHSAGVYDTDNDEIPGLNGESYVNYVQSRDSSHHFTTEELIRPLIDNQLQYPYAPGAGYHYSNTGYAILSRIIERVYSARSGSAKTYADYVETRITGPSAPVPVPVSFPYLPNDVRLPAPNVASIIRQPGGLLEGFGAVKMSAHVGEGNGYSTMAGLNTYIRSMMRGENVLKPQTVQLMQTTIRVTPTNDNYGLGCIRFTNLGYGHNGAIAGYLSLMAYDPATDTSVVAVLPLWDYTKGFDTFLTCFLHMYYASYAAKGALGYPILK